MSVGRACTWLALASVSSLHATPTYPSASSAEGQLVGAIRLESIPINIVVAQTNLKRFPSGSLAD